MDRGAARGPLGGPRGRGGSRREADGEHRAQRPAEGHDPRQLERPHALPPERRAQGALHLQQQDVPLVLASAARPEGDQADGPGRADHGAAPERPLQVAYRGEPLYTFVQDTKRGDVKGEGFKDVGVWHAATVGAAATTTATTTTATTTTSGVRLRLSLRSGRGVHPPRPGRRLSLDWPRAPGGHPLRRPHAGRPLRRRAAGSAARRPRGDGDRGGGRARGRRPRARSRTSGSAAPTRPVRTTATSRGWARCSRGCRSRSRA